MELIIMAITLKKESVDEHMYFCFLYLSIGSSLPIWIEYLTEILYSAIMR